MAEIDGMTPAPSRLAYLRSPEGLLLLMATAMPLSFATWQALLNNFVIERAAFTGAEIGILQSLREVPGFLAFTVVFALLLIREQSLALLSIAVLGIGTAVTGVFPTVLGLYVTTVVMSIGFHYNETIQQSLALQWVDHRRAPLVFGRIIAAASVASLAAYGLVWVAFDIVHLDFIWVYAPGGGATIAIAVTARTLYPRFPAKVEQHKTIVLRRRYWLYYALTFFSGARRQIFMVFAAFMMVEKFGYAVSEITALYLLNYATNIWLAPLIGRMIGRWGERRALALEYIGLICVFTAYTFVGNAVLAAVLFVIDHLFFAMAIAIKTYFQKVCDPRDIAPTAAVSFTINHIAAVVIPVVFGFIWLVSPAAVFLTGAAIAAMSLACAQLMPHAPAPGRETRLAGVAPAAAE